MMREAEPTESELVRKARAGDREAFLRLIRRHDRQVMSVIYRWAGDRWDREDLYQDIFLHAFRSVRRFRSRSSFRTWLYRLAFQRCVSFARRRRPVVEAPEQAVPPEDPESRARGRALRRALDRLPEQQRLCVVLHYVEGWTVREIAESLQRSEGTVKTHLYRAREALRTTEEVLRWQPITS